MSIQQIDTLSLHDALQHNRAVIIDVREISEYEEAYIEGAVLVPMGQCQPASLPSNPDKMIVFQCRKGGRSQRVAEAYAQAYPERTIYNLAGGIEAWIAAGLPVNQV